MDIYGTPAEMEKAYIEFASKIRDNGRLLIKKGLSREQELKGANTLTYSFSDSTADVYVKDLKIENGSYVFDVVRSGKTYSGFVLNVGGTHNVENMTAAIAVALDLSIEEDKIKTAVAAYAGVKRRFEYGVKSDAFVYIDDYAHHPEELRALISSVKMLYADKQVKVIFQPHLFSRTNDLATEFAEVLDMADDVIVLPIYPARELPMEGVTSALITSKMKQAKVCILDKPEVLKAIEEEKDAMRAHTVLITAGAGDIDRMIEPIKQILTA